MKWTAILLFSALFVGISPKKVDFGKHKDGQNWQIINDGVMGGLSKGDAYLLDNSILFKGEVSLENNGGFASLRAPMKRYDLGNHEIFKFRFKGTARKFAILFETDRAFWRPNYKFYFTPNPNEWQTIEVPFTNFKTHRMGEPSGGYLTESKLSEIIRYGVILYDKKAGEFELEMDFIAFE